MGNAQSDVTNNVKAQADGQESETYKLLNVKDGGELIQLMRDPVLKRNKALLDEEIRKRVLPCLYNEGRGQDIPIQDIVYHRSPNKEAFKANPAVVSLKKMAQRKKGPFTKKIYWDIDKRGAVGETALHICLLVGSTLHKELAKRLVRLFPGLVNDFYLSDEYYGENPLHMAIVNEDPNMVKFLLSYNVNFHQRCCGKFFCPDDQKNHRQDALTQEYPILKQQTNYSGLSYYGEYPLSFAAVMNQTDCVRLLLACGVDPNKQDSNGNTVLHMLVIHNNLEMFQFLLSYGARLDIKNRLNYTPLTLATQMARKEIFTFIMEKMRTVYWVYADIACAAHPLTDLDTISQDGTTNSNSVLYSIVNSESEDHLELLDGLVLGLLQEKWKNYIKIRFYLQILFFLIFFGLTSTVLIMKRIYFDHLRKVHDSEVNERVSDNFNDDNSTIERSPVDLICINVTKTGSYLIPECECALLSTEDPYLYIRATIEIIVLLLALTSLSLAAKELYTEKFSLYFRMLLGNPTKFLYLASCVTLLLIIPFRFSCDTPTEDVLSVLAVICMTLHFMFYCRGFRRVGPFVLMIQKMAKGDLMRFFIIYSVFLLGFSQAIHVAAEFGVHTERTSFNTPLESMMAMFVISMGEFADLYNQLDNLNYALIGKILFLVYAIIVGLLLINMLIAMMGNTYASVNEKKNEWLRQWAKVVLAVEISVSRKDRIKFQKRYSHLLNNGERALVVRWKQSEFERNELLSGKKYFHERIKDISEYKLH